MENWFRTGKQSQTLHTSHCVLATLSPFLLLLLQLPLLLLQWAHVARRDYPLSLSLISLCLSLFLSLALSLSLSLPSDSGQPVSVGGQDCATHGIGVSENQGYRFGSPYSRTVIFWTPMSGQKFFCWQRRGSIFFAKVWLAHFWP